MHALSFNPDGTLLAIAAGTPAVTGELRVFNLADGQIVADLVRSDDVVLGVAFSPDGTRLAACGADRAIRLYAVDTWAEQVTIEDHADWVLDIAWTPDGNRLLSASRDKTSKVFDAATGDALATFNGHGEVVYAVASLPDSAHAVTVGANKTAHVWQIADAKEVRKLGGAGDELLGVKVGANGAIYTAGADQHARRYEPGTATLQQDYAGHGDWVTSIALNPAADQLVTGSQDGMVRIWDSAGMLIREWPVQP
ncbi:MAG: WD40 repeat domain-containing protein [Planctomycetaceae bacterium]